MIVNGAARADRIAELEAIFDHVHLINARPFELAMANLCAGGNLLTKEVGADSNDRMVTFSRNLRCWAAAVKKSADCVLRIQ